MNPLPRIAVRFPRRAARFAAAIALSVALPLAPAWADDTPPAVDPAPIPGTPDSVAKLIDAPYLTPDEAKDKRIFFGRYTLADLDTPARAARAALIRGVYDDPALLAADADPLDRAEAALNRGDLAQAIEQVKDAPSLRAALIRAQALFELGQTADSLAAIDAAIDRAAKAPPTDPESVVAAVRLVALRIRLAGPLDARPGAGIANDYTAMMRKLADVRTAGDRFWWPAMLAEAELLYSKDNKGEAGPLLNQVLELNPTSADAWELIGQMTVDGFQFDKTEQIARRLNLMASPEFDPARADEVPAGVSAAGGQLIARAMLRQSEGQLALDALTPVLSRYPRLTEARALRCAAEAVRFDQAARDECLAAFDRDYGSSYRALFLTGRALAEARQYAPAEKFLNMAAERLPNASEPWTELGLVLVQAGRDDAALAALEKSFALDPFNVRADNSLRLVRELQTYKSIESPHFIIRYKPSDGPRGGADALLAREMVAPLEDNHATVCANPDTAGQPGGIDHEPAAKTIIDLMPDHEWFAVRIAGMPRIHTIAAATGPLIAMEAPRDGPKHSGTYDWARVVRHEYTHTVTLSRTNNRIPHWFTEAAAVYLELSPRDYSTCQLLARALESDGLFDFQQINIAFVRPAKPTDRGQAYAQGHWMYEYIIKTYGARAPLQLMDKYAAGVREEEAFQSVLGVSRAQFMEGFKSWARTQLISWGMVAPEGAGGSPTLRSLLAREALADDKTPAEARAALQAIADGKPLPDGADDPDLPEPTPDMIARWLAAHPDHPDILELAVDEGVKAAGGAATPDLVPLLERYAAARPVDPKPHRLLAKMYLDQAAADPTGVALADQASKAIPHLEYLDAREQRTPAYAMELARRYAAIDDFTRASAKALRATQIAPYEPRPRELAATIAIQARDFPAAEHQITALTILEPEREVHKKRLEALKKLQPGAAGEQSPKPSDQSRE